MDAKKKQALIKELAIERKFDNDYSDANRRWFVDKLIRVFEGIGFSDGQIEQKTRDVVPTTKAIAAAKRDVRARPVFVA